MRLLTLFWASSLLASTLQAQVTVDTSFASGGFHRMAEAQTTYKTVAHLPLPQGGSVSVNSFKLAGAPTVCPDNRQCLFTALERIVVVGSANMSAGDSDFAIARITYRAARHKFFWRWKNDGCF